MSIHSRFGWPTVFAAAAWRRLPPVGGPGKGILVACALLLIAPPSPAQTAELLLRSNVPDATVSVDDRQVGVTGGDGDVLIENLDSGPRTIRVRKSGYWTASTQAVLEPGLTNVVALELTAREAEATDLLLETNVPEAQVRLDGTRRAETGADGRVTLSNVEPGRHRLVVRKEGYASAARTVSVSASVSSQTVRVRLDRGGPGGPDPSARTGGAGPGGTASVIDSIVSDATVPDSATGANEGRDDASSRLIVSANVEGARVYVNGTYRGTTAPNGELAVEADTGQYQVLLQKDGTSSRQNTGRLSVGETRTLSFTLRPEEPAPVRAFIREQPVLVAAIGIGAVLVGGGIVAVLLWRRRSATGAEGSIDRYRMVEPIGTEGITTVSLAEDLVEDRYVVLKLLDEAYEDDPAIVEAFLKQGEALRHIAVSGPDVPVVKAFRYGREKEWDRKRAFIELEYVQGERLSAYLEEHDLGVREALTVVQQVCTGLQAAHDRQLWHGQLTPDHVIVTATDPEIRVKLVNFQVGADHRARSEATSPDPPEGAEHVAPEQRRGEGVDGRTDVYAAGILFGTMMTGRPFSLEQPHEEGARETGRPSLPDVPSHIESLVRRMLDPTPENRPSASRVADMIELVRETT
jgi:hypothetical protein